MKDSPTLENELHNDELALPLESYANGYAIDAEGWNQVRVSGLEPTRRTQIRKDPGKVSSKDHLDMTGIVVNQVSQDINNAEPTILLGDMFKGFQFLHELGHGAFGRVFLAKQEGLAGRFVALKVSRDAISESQHLARLQHTNIVPIYSLHRAGELHAVCMPYFGCTTLADLCNNLGQSEGMPTSGRLVVSTVQNRRSTLRGLDKSLPVVPQADLPSRPTVAPALLSLEEMAYVDAVLWIGAQLAEGLHHAHECGILHLDLKPANVLLTDDGRPMLLDFNLAEKVTDTNSANRAHVGGTLPYMSPEQMRAFSGISIDFDARTDIYALGLILYQLLTGRLAFPTYQGAANQVLNPMLEDRIKGAPLLRPGNPVISPAVEAIVLKCLEADREKRYKTAQELAEDIKRHRAHLPLLHTKESSWHERCVKWLRRNPKIASPWVAATVMITIAACIITGTAIWSHNHEKRNLENLMEARRIEANRKFREFNEILHAANHLLTAFDPKNRQEALHLALKALNIYGVLIDSNWKRFPLFTDLVPTERDELDTSITALASLIVHSRIIADGSPEVKQFEAFINANLEKNPNGNSSHFNLLRATELVAQKKHHNALPYLESAILDSPQSLFTWFLKARCHHHLGQSADAAFCYGRCLSLNPSFIHALQGRGALHYSHTGNLHQALADFKEALRLNEDYLEARIDLATVYHRLGNNNEALSHLDKALTVSNCPPRVFFIREKVKRTLGDTDGADLDLKRGLETKPIEAVDYISRGFALKDTDHLAALADFTTAEKINPRSFESLNNQAHIYGDILKQNNKAVQILDRAFRMYPENTDMRSARAVFMARVGRSEEALNEISRLLHLIKSPVIYYRAACVYSITAKDNPDRLRDARRWLSRAISEGFGIEEANNDSDLLDLWNDPESNDLFESIQELLRNAK